MPSSPQPPYLQPYHQAAQRLGPTTQALLWISPTTQAARFNAFQSLYNFNDASILDVGCGRADFLDHLLFHNVFPKSYTGLEAVPAFIQSAQQKQLPYSKILPADFIQNPQSMNQNAQIILFSGSLNTLSPTQFHQTLQVAFSFAQSALLFNFLASPTLAAAPYLTWHNPNSVLQFAQSLTPNLQLLQNYLPGDATLALWKSTPPP